MRRSIPPVVSSALVALTIVAATAVSTATSAAAAPVTVEGRTSGALLSPGTVHLDYTISVTGSALHQSAFVLDVPTGDVPEASSVRVQGATPSAATVTAADNELTVRLGSGADASSGGTLAVSAYLLSVDVSLPAKQRFDSVAAARLDHTEDATLDSVAAQPVPLVAPKLTVSLPPHSGDSETGLLPLGDAQTGEFAVDLRNSGAPVAGATLTIDLPSSLALDVTDDTVQRVDGWRLPNGANERDLTCDTSSPTHVTCPVGAVAHGADALLIVPVTPTRQAVYQAHAPFSLTVLPDDAEEATPADNTVDATVVFTGTARLVAALTESARRVHVGHSARVRLRITNEGPQPAVDAFSEIGIDSDAFALTAIGGHPVDFATAAAAHHPRPAGAAAVARAGSAWSIHRADEPPTADEFDILGFGFGTIKVGQSVSVIITLTAHKTGHAEIDTDASSDAGDPTCNDPASTTCRARNTLILTAVKAAHK